MGIAPAELTSFIGRESELRDLRGLGAERRLVTLTGPGGCGKSRLAARYCTDEVDPGVPTRWVDLGSVADPSLVVRAVADSVDVLLDPGPDAAAASLVTQLRDERLLICLDTCEHLVDAVAALADRLLRTCPDVRLITTSREPLAVAGETVYRVPNLIAADAAKLFADRAALVDPRSDLRPAQADVASICSRLDGIPLAVELAAAWTSTLAPERIASGLDDSLHLLGGGPRTALPRHRTLMASLDWSHALLDDDEQRMLRRLSVFSGSFRAGAAYAVAAPDEPEPDALGILRRLVDKSLVVVQPGEETRYRMLDVVRQYAGTRLVSADELEATRDRHLDHYLAAVVAAEPGLETDQDTWRVVLEREHDQVHVALQRSLQPDQSSRHRRGAQLAAAMARQWFVRGQSQEGLAFVERAIDLVPDGDVATLARLHGGRALLGMVAGRVDVIEESGPIAESLAAEIGDDVVFARARVMRAYPPFFVDPEQCQQMAEEAVRLADHAGDALARDWAMNLAAYSMTRRDRHDEAVALARPAYAQSMARADRLCGGFALGVEVFAKAYTGDVTGAVELGLQVQQIVEPLGDYFGYGSNVTNVALAVGMSGDLDGALAMMHSVVRSVEDAKDVDVVGYMFTYGLLALWSGDTEGAHRWLSRGVRLLDTFEWTAIRCLAPLATAQRRLGRVEEAVETAVRAAEMAAAVDGEYVLAEAWDERARLTADTDAAGAFDLHHRALALRREFGLRTFYPDSLDALAQLAAATRTTPDAAVRSLAASGAARATMGYPRPPAGMPDYERALDALRSQLGDEAFGVHWEAGERLSLDEAVAVVTRGRGPHDRPETGWASLTPTELDVARMVADGLSNPEIGRRLYVSRSTVKTHLSHAYAKLGISGRAELAARVVSQATEE